MTVESTTSRTSHTGAGTTGPFSIPFYFLADEDIRVIKVLLADGTETELVLNTDFTLTGAGDENGGELTTTAAVTSSYKIVIFRDPDALQESDYAPNDAFPSETHEQVADRLTMIAQRQNDLLGRALVQPDGDGDLDMRLPAVSVRASKYLAFDADGKPVATAGTGESAVITTFSETVLDDDSAGGWLTTLGFSAFVKTLIDAASASAFNTLLGMSTFFKTLLGAADAAALRALVDVFSTDEAWPTGRVRLLVGTTAASGWVLLDDGTIGNAASGASTRANADTEDLFVHLWTVCADAECPVSSGRGASAEADYAANKTLGLPKTVGRALGVYGAGSGLTARALGATVGTETHTLTEDEMPEHDHPTTGLSSNGTGAGLTTPGTNQTDGSENDNTGMAGGGDPHNNMQPTSFLNAEIKL